MHVSIGEEILAGFDSLLQFCSGAHGFPLVEGTFFCLLERITSKVNGIGLLYFFLFFLDGRHGDIQKAAVLGKTVIAVVVGCGLCGIFATGIP